MSSALMVTLTVIVRRSLAVQVLVMIQMCQPSAVELVMRNGEVISRETADMVIRLVNLVIKPFTSHQDGIKFFSKFIQIST